MGLRMVSRILILLALVLTAGFPPAGASTCTSSTGCTDCESLRSGSLTCKFVNSNASCHCEISSFGGSPTCAVDGDCTYAPGGGGGGGGGGGNNDPGCSRVPGQWCPADCSSCTTVFFY